MKVMILSDSHSMPRSDLLTLLKTQNVDYYIHCGDIYLTYDSLPLNNFYNCRGNNDNRNIKEELFITIDNLKFWIVHGHRYNVEFNTEGLAYNAKQQNIDVVCFGHTHRPYLQTEDNITYINPGSVTYPRGDYHNPTYCIFDTTTKEVTYYDVKTNSICNPFEISKKTKKSILSFFKKK